MTRVSGDSSWFLDINALEFESKETDQASKETVQAVKHGCISVNDGVCPNF